MSAKRRSTWLGAIAGALAWTGCGAAAPLEPETTAVAPPAGDSHSGTPTPTPQTSPEAAMSPLLARPTDVACSYQVAAWAPSANPQVLRVAQRGRVFAELRGAPSAELVVTLSDVSHDTWVSAEHEGTQVVGWLSLDELTLHPARAIPIGDFGVIETSAELAVMRGEAGSLAFELEAMSSFTPAAPMLSVVPCDAVSPNRSEFDARAAVSLPWHAPPQRVSMSADVERLLVATVGGEPRGTIRSDSVLPVERLESRGRNTRILLEDRDVLVFGWVPSAGLAPVTDRLFPHDVARPSAQATALPGRVLQCPRALPFLVDVGDGPVRVGTIAARTPLHVVAGDHGDATFALDWLVPTPNARFVLAAATLATCVPP